MGPLGGGLGLVRAGFHRGSRTLQIQRGLRHVVRALEDAHALGAGDWARTPRGVRGRAGSVTESAPSPRLMAGHLPGRGLRGLRHGVCAGSAILIGRPLEIADSADSVPRTRRGFRAFESERSETGWVRWLAG